MTKITLKNDLITIKNFDLPKASNGIPQLHIIGAMIGNSGSGKSNAAVNLIRECQKQDLFDIYTLISPTGTKDPVTGIQPEKKWSLIKFDEQFGDYNPTILDTVVNNQKQRIVDYQDYLDELELYRKWQNRKKVPLEPWEELFIDENYEDEGPEKPTNPNKRERYPLQCIILDDCGGISQHDESMKNFVSRSRHNNASIINLVQYSKMIPKSYRNQLNMLLIFKTSDKASLKDLWTEFASSDMDVETFLEMFEALEHRHEFIMIDQKVPNRHEKYRHNFDEYIDVDKLTQD